jgi:hypothetical protein
MKADTNMSGKTTAHNKICSDNTFSRSEAEGNSSRPCITNQVAITEMMRRQKLNPPEPKRAVAHINKTRGRNKSAGVVDGKNGPKPKTKKAAAAALTTNNPASPNRPSVAFLIQDLPADEKSTTTGTIVSSASALVQNLSALSDRYPRPHFVRTTPAASKNEVAKGAMRTPNNTKMNTPRTLSNTFVGRTNCPIQNAPIKASLTLVASHAAAVQIGTPASSWARKCAGTTVIRSAHQTRRGASRKAASRTAFAGQNAEFGCPAGVKANPTRVPA